METFLQYFFCFSLSCLVYFLSFKFFFFTLTMKTCLFFYIEWKKSKEIWVFIRLCFSTFIHPTRNIRGDLSVSPICYWWIQCVYFCLWPNRLWENVYYGRIRKYSGLFCYRKRVSSRNDSKICAPNFSTYSRLGTKRLECKLFFL